MKRIATIFAILLVMIGCVTTKDKGYQKQTDFSSLDSLRSTIEDSIKAVYEEKYREVGFYIDFYNHNRAENEAAIEEMQNALYDSAVASDSLRNMIKNFKCPESKVRYNTDGSVEVTGKIKTLSSKILDLQKSLDLAKRKTEVKSGVQIKTLTNTVTVTKVKKTKPIWWLYVVIAVAFYILGGRYPLPKLFPAVKRFLPWV